MQSETNVLWVFKKIMLTSLTQDIEMANLYLLRYFKKWEQNTTEITHDKSFIFINQRSRASCVLTKFALWFWTLKSFLDKSENLDMVNIVF